MNESAQMTFDELVVALHDTSAPLAAAAIYRLSALPQGDRDALLKVWPGLPVERRRALLVRLNEVSEANFEVDFTAVAELALQDADEEVRQRAIACLWEVKAPWLMRRLMTVLEDDSSAAVREEAASGLGRYVLQAELGKLPPEEIKPVEERLLMICRSAHEPLDVRRRALESIGYSSHKEVPTLIEDAYFADAQRMRVSAVFAMGRSADERWAPYVLQELEGEDPELRYEAAQAAGELRLSDAIPLLADLLEGDDVEVVSVSIWSLGEIGGPEARRALNEATRWIDDDDLLEAIDDALSMVALSDGLLGLIELPDNEEPG